MATLDRAMIIPTKEYRINELCKLLDGIDRHTLLRYTRAGKIIARYRQVSPNKAIKYYLGSDVIDYLNRTEIVLKI